MDSAQIKQWIEGVIQFTTAFATDKAPAGDAWVETKLVYHRPPVPSVVWHAVAVLPNGHKFQSDDLEHETAESAIGEVNAKLRAYAETALERSKAINAFLESSVNLMRALTPST